MDTITTPNPTTRGLRGGGVALTSLGDETERRDFGWSRMVYGRHGTFLANPRDQYVGRSLLEYGEFSEGEVALFGAILKAGDTVIEAGANIGAHTVPLAGIVGPMGAVFAIEPQRLQFLNLCSNLFLNGITNTRAVFAALGEQFGVAEVPVLDPWTEANFGGLSLNVGEGERVNLFTVDDQFGVANLALIKADVEGMEVAVLKGARKTIARAAPALYVEADREEQTAELLALVESFGYEAWWHFPPLFNPENYTERSDNIFGGTVSINLLCLPRSRAEQGESLLPGARAEAGDTWTQAAKRLGL